MSEFDQCMKKAAQSSEEGDMAGAIRSLQKAYQKGGMDARNLLTVAGSLYGLAEQLLPSSDYKTCQNAHGMLERAHAICQVLSGSKNPSIASIARQRRIQCQVALQSAKRQMNAAAPKKEARSKPHASRERVDPYARRPGEQPGWTRFRNFSQTRTAADAPRSHKAQSASAESAQQPKPTTSTERTQASSPHFGQAPEPVVPTCAKAASKPDPRMAKWVGAHTFANTAVSEPSLHGVG